MSDEVIESTELFFQEQPSDKVYNTTLLKTAKGYTVAVEWGRRGAKLSTGTKAVDAPLDKAQKAYAKVIKQKLKKGYEELTAGNQPAAVAPAQGQGSASKAGVQRRAQVGSPAQLLNSTSEDQLDALFADANIVAQQKLDGMRLLVHVRDTGLLATNRNGQETALPKAIAKAVETVPVGTILDGELVADPLTYWVFDLLAWASDDLRKLPYSERYTHLADAPGLYANKDLVLVPVAKSEADKRKLYATLLEQNAEGIVFKAKDAPYESGRAASGGPQLKHKFVKTADVFITANVGNAYQMAVVDKDGTQHEVGKVFAGTTSELRKTLDTMLSDQELPVAEVRYLYASKDDILYQPVFVRLRDDKEPSACLLAQLEYTDRAGVTQI